MHDAMGIRTWVSTMEIMCRPDGDPRPSIDVAKRAFLAWFGELFGQLMQERRIEKDLERSSVLSSAWTVRVAKKRTR